MLIQKQMRLPVRRSLSQPGVQHGIGIGAQQDDAFLPPLATHTQPGRLLTLGGTEQRIDLQRHHFTDAEAAVPHQHEPGPIAGGCTFATTAQL